MSSDLKRVPLFERLPEIYRVRDAEQFPPDQLRAFLEAIEPALGAVHENIEQLYHDLFIETCDDWVIPYIADLVGTTHLSGDPWTLRADVADTIALRRRKGTRVALERLAANLTGWAARAVELRENLGWTQHLNHQRPDAGGVPPLSRPHTRFAVPRGGTATIRDPATLALLGTPFDPFAYTADVSRAHEHQRHINLPNLALFLWRLVACTLPPGRPVAVAAPAAPPPPFPVGEAAADARFELDPLGWPVRLFNTWNYDPEREPPVLTAPDDVSGPILDARLTTGADAGNPAAYVALDTYDPAAPGAADGLNASTRGLTLFLPSPTFTTDPTQPGGGWRFRGDNLCAWRAGLRRPLRDREIVIDPDIGRLLVGLGSAAESAALEADLLVSHTYGAPGPVGAQPIDRDAAPTRWLGAATEIRAVPSAAWPTLEAALANLSAAVSPVVVELRDSRVHDLNPATLPGVIEGGSLNLAHSLILRGAPNHRPIVRLAAPLRFRPVVPGDPSVDRLTVRLEGLFIVRNELARPGLPVFPAATALVTRAALHRLELLGCTLEPGGRIPRRRTDPRTPIITALELTADGGFADPAELAAFRQVPEVFLRRTISGPLRVDEDHRLTIEDSIIDAGAGVLADGSAVWAIASVANPAVAWSGALALQGATFFGRVRVASIHGQGGIFVRLLEVLDNQRGCLKFCYFSPGANRLPANHACVHGDEARLVFTAEAWREPGYGQLALASDWRVRERGPGDDAMGAYGFLLEAHRWANLRIRCREFMPVGIHPLLIPVT